MNGYPWQTRCNLGLSGSCRFLVRVSTVLSEACGLRSFRFRLDWSCPSVRASAPGLTAARSTTLDA